MRKTFTLLFLYSITLSACSDSANDKKTDAPIEIYEAGTILVEDSTRIVEDELNELYYTVKVVATDSSDKGYYIVRAAYGYNIAEGLMALPDLHEPLKPAMIKNPDLPYSYIIGFTKASENYKIYHDYFEVKSDKENHQMRYIKSYYFEKVKK